MSDQIEFRRNLDGSVAVDFGGHAAMLSPAQWAAAVAHVAQPAEPEGGQKQAALDLHMGVPVGTELALAFHDDDGNQGLQRIETPKDGETLAVILRQQNPTITETKNVRRNVFAWVPVE